MEPPDDDNDRSTDDMVRKMYQHNERLMRNPGDGRGAGPRARPGPAVHPGAGWSPPPPRPSPGRSWDGYPSWERGDYGHRLIDQMTQLAEEAVRGAGDLAYRLADLAASLPTPRPVPLPPFPGLPPYPGHDPGPPSDGHGHGHGPGPGSLAPPTLALPSVARGNTAQGELDLENTTNRPVCNLRLRCSSLVGNDGQSIPGHHLSVAPPLVTLGPWASTRVVLMVSVPPEAVPGRYVGLVEGDDDALQCLVALTVF